jgi:hypothetical protein
MKKLVLVFEDGEEVEGIEKCLVFHNEHDAKKYFLEVNKEIFQRFAIDSEQFVLTYAPGWKGVGKVYWAEMPY